MQCVFHDSENTLGMTLSTPTVIFAVYRGFSVRYLLESGVLEGVCHRGIRAVIMHPDSDSEYLRDKFGRYGVEFEPFPIAEIQSLTRTGLLATLFERVRYYTYAGQDEAELGTRRINQDYTSNSLKSKLAALPAWLCRRSALARALLLKVSERYYSREAEEIFRRRRPSLVVTSSIGYAYDSAVMRAAARCGIPVVGIPHSWDNTSTKGYRGADPDHVIAWSDIMRREMQQYHEIAPERILLGGVAHWDKYFDDSFAASREAALAGLNIPVESDVIFYAPTNYRHIPTTFDEVAFLLERISAGDLGPHAFLVLRLHPTYMIPKSEQWRDKVEQDLKRVETLAEKFCSCFRVNYPKVVLLEGEYAYPIEDMLDYAALLKHSAVMLTEYSTCAIESCVFDVPVINVSYQNWRDTGRPATETVAHFDHLKRIFSVGAIKHAMSREELLSQILGYLADRSQDAEARAELVTREVSANKGQAARRVSEMICAIARGDSPRQL